MKNEAGFGLIDIMVVLAIAATIAAGAGAITVQLYRVTKSSEEHATVARQAQNLGSWISRDLMMAVSANTSDDPGTPEAEFITIEWKDWETGSKYEARYSWVDSTAQEKKVLRKQRIWDISGALVGSVSTLVADSIYSANLSLPLANPKTLTVQALSGERSASRQYQTSTRPE